MNHETIWSRVASLRERMRTIGLDAFAMIVVERSNWEGAYYISGFRGSSSGIVITQSDMLLNLFRLYWPRLSKAFPKLVVSGHTK